ncbi:MAG: RimK family alpha-L-glutamate ligase [Candidatus Nanohaloarchaea archaeon]
MKLLIISENSLERFEDYFEEVDRARIDEVAPEVRDRGNDIKIEGESIRKYDCVYTEIPGKNAVFGRVLLEMIEDERIPVNHSSTGFFVSAKKNYLYYTLHEQNIPAAKTAIFSTEKASRSIEKQLKGPVVGRKFENLEEVENRKIDTVDSISEFVEGAEYQEDLFIFHEHRPGDKIKCLVIEDQVIGLRDDSEGWRFKDKNLKYSNISDRKEEIVKTTAKKIGAPMAEVMLRGDKVYDVNPNPDLERYTQLSGKNAFEAAAEMLKQEASK